MPLDGGKPTALTAVNTHDNAPGFQGNYGNWNARRNPRDALKVSRQAVSLVSLFLTKLDSSIGPDPVRLTPTGLLMARMASRRVGFTLAKTLGPTIPSRDGLIHLDSRCAFVTMSTCQRR